MEEKVDKSNGIHEPATVTEENVDKVSGLFESLEKKEKISMDAGKENSTTEAVVADMFKGLTKKKKKSKKAIIAEPTSADNPLPSSITEEKEGEVTDKVTDMFEGLAKKQENSKKASNEIPAEPASAENPLPSSTTEEKEGEVRDMFAGLAKKKKKSKKASNEIPAEPASAEDPLPSSTTEEKEGEVKDMFEGQTKKKKKSKKASSEIHAGPASAEDSLPSSTTEGRDEKNSSKDLTKKKEKKSTKVGDDSSAEAAKPISADSPIIDASAPTMITEEQVGEVTDLFKGLAKKKKSKRTDKKTKSAEPTEAEAEAEAEAGAGEEEGGDPDEGTGIWNHNAKKDLSYGQLLDRFYQILQDKNPDMMSGKVKSYKIPPPQCVREGNKKTIFANIADICNRMERSDDHVTSYLFAELGTNGSVDASRRLVIKGRFQQKQIENVLRRYISTFQLLFSHLPPFPKVPYNNSNLLESFQLNLGVQIQWNTSLAKPVAPKARHSARAKTGYTLLLAIHAVAAAA